MATVTDIGTLIVETSGVARGRPEIAGTGVSVGQVARSYKMGRSPEEIADQCGHMNLAQVHAALAYYYANQGAIDAELTEEEAEYDRLASAQSLGIGMAGEQRTTGEVDQAEQPATRNPRPASRNYQLTIASSYNCDKIRDAMCE